MARHHAARVLPVLLACAATLTAAGTAAALIGGPPGPSVAGSAAAAPTNGVEARSEPAAVLAAPADATTTTTVPPPATTVPPAPTPAPQPSSAEPVPAPAPAPVAPQPVVTPVPAPPPATLLSLADRFRAAYETAVPAAWRAAITVSLEPIAGSTSWGWPDGRIQISERHAANDAVLKVTIAHEFGHLIAYRYGTQSPAGAPPAGWPAYSSQPAEAWADCVSRAMTGIDDPSHGLPSCSGASLSWTATWLAQGPGAHPRTT